MDNKLRAALDQWDTARKALDSLKKNPLKMPRIDVSNPASEYVAALQQRYKALQDAYDALMELNAALWATASKEGVVDRVMERLRNG